MKKTIALLLALVLCMSVFAGCSKAPAETPATNAPAAPSDSDTPAPAEEAFSFEGKTVDVWVRNDLDGHDIEKFVEEATGIDVKYVKTSEDTIFSTFTDKVTPSIVFRPASNDGHTFGRYGVFVNFYDYEELLPNFFAKYNQYGDEIKKEYETAPGELYTLPAFPNGNKERTGWIYREDIFEELGLSIPTNWEEFLDVCAALKAAYPDSYPFTSRDFGSYLNHFQNWGRQFGCEWNWGNPEFDETTETYYNPFTTDNAFVMVGKVRELIELGYMDIATLGNDDAMWTADISTGKSFITYDKPMKVTGLEEAGKEVNPDFKLSWWNNVPMNEAGENFNYHVNSTVDYAYGWVVTSKCPDIETAIRFLDWMYSDEGSEILSWGKEGVSFEVDADGNKSFIEGYNTAYYADYLNTPNIDFNATLASFSPTGQAMALDTLADSRLGVPSDPTLAFNDEENAVIQTYKTDWANVYKTYWQKFLLGELELNEANWEKMKSEMAAHGEAELIAAYTSAYQRYKEG